MAGMDVPYLVSLSDRLFTGPERVGWRYQEPTPARPSPLAGQEPQWRPPAGPHPDAMTERAERTRRGLLWQVPLVAVVASPLLLAAYFFLTDPFVLFLLVLPLVVVPALLAGVMVLRWGPAFVELVRAHGKQGTASRQWAAAWSTYTASHAHWRYQVEQWDTAEQARVANADLWVPMDIGRTSRVEVVGGTAEGWSSLITTWGAAALTTGRSVLLADLTGEDVGAALLAVSSRRGVPVRACALPGDLQSSGLMSRLSGQQTASVMAAAARGLRDNRTDVHLDLLDADILRGVVQRLSGPVSLSRLRAALCVLERTSGAGNLAADEVERLAAYVDDVGTDVRVQDEVRFLRIALDLILDVTDVTDVTDVPTSAGSSGDAESPAASPWLAGGLSVLWTDGPERRQEVVGRLAAQALVELLDGAGVGLPQGATLVLAGADRLDRDTLDAVLRRARRAGVRCLMLVETLRDGFEQILGSGDATVVIMRLGNARDASLAAEFIGRGHSFTLTQVSRQVGETTTTGESASRTESTSTTDSRALSETWSASGRSRTRSWSDATTYGLALTKGSSRSTAESVTTGEVTSRVYDFAVEPTALQSLDPTALLVIGSHDGKRSVLGGTCDPFVAALDRVATTAPGIASSPAQDRPPGAT